LKTTYVDAVRDLRRHRELGGTAQDHVELVRYATLAASSHNTQPWKFRLAGDVITILPDFSRRCPAVDPDDHHLFASLGCAAENMLLAARAAGWQGHLSHVPSEPGLTVALERASALRDPLFEVIPRRQCSRAEYDGGRLTAQEQGLLEGAGRGEGVSLLLLYDAKHIDGVAEYVAAGNEAQFRDPAWARELKHWIRFNALEAVQTGDGLYGPSMGSPDVPRWIGRLAMRFGFSAAKQNRKDVRYIRSSSAIAVFVSEVDDPRHWIESGRCYERFALQATALGLSTAFINQPVEVPSLRPQLAAFLGVREGRVDLVVRVGRGPAMPPSLRRPVEEVLIP
jgi:hypothetical protein